MVRRSDVLVVFPARDARVVYRPGSELVGGAIWWPPFRRRYRAE
jgi:hypothetical protein